MSYQSILTTSTSTSTSSIGFGVENEIPADNSLLGQGYDFYSKNPKSNIVCDVNEKNLRVVSDNELGGKSYYEIIVLKSSNALARYYGFKGKLDAKYGPFKGTFKAKHVSSIQAQKYTINIVARAISILNKEFLEPRILDKKFLKLLRSNNKSLLKSYGTHYVNQRVNGGELNFIFSYRYSNLYDYMSDYKSLKIKYDSGFSEGGSLSLEKMTEIKKKASKSQLTIFFFKNGSPLINEVNEDNFLNLINEFSHEVSPENSGTMNGEKTGRYTTLALGVEELNELPEIDEKFNEKYVNWIRDYRKKLVKFQNTNQILLEKAGEIEEILDNDFEYNFKEGEYENLKSIYNSMELKIKNLEIDYDALKMNPLINIDFDSDDFRPIDFEIPNKKEIKPPTIVEIPPKPKTEWIEDLNGIRNGIHETFITSLEYGKKYILEISGRVRRKKHKTYYPYHQLNENEFLSVRFKDSKGNNTDTPYFYDPSKPFLIEEFPYKAKLYIVLNCNGIRNHPNEFKLKAKLILVS